MAVGLAVWLTGCLTVDVPEIRVVSPGTPFVVAGVAVTNGTDETCLEWVGDNQIVYHLFQDPDLDNEAFDRVATPGVRSRLELRSREDIPVACGIGLSVEVLEVLEIEDTAESTE
jgi:hypothetical protein